jgi:nucleotide-binding universal stress UspA family protein
LSLPRGLKQKGVQSALATLLAENRSANQRPGERWMFRKILHANDGSEPAFHALGLALAIARQNNSDLHMVSVEEIDYIPEFIEEIREETGTAARRFHKVLQRAHAMAEQRQVKLHTHVLAGHPVRDIVELAAELKVDLLVIGSKGHSAIYERLVGSRANRIMQLAQCAVLVVK